MLRLQIGRVQVAKLLGKLPAAAKKLNIYNGDDVVLSLVDA